MDDYWNNYDACLDEIQHEGSTVDGVIRICNKYFGKSVGDAFFPGGGDRDMLGTLSEAGWDIYWAAADYHFKARKNGRSLEYVEGDIYADPKPRSQLTAPPVTDAAADHHTPARDLGA